MSLYPDAPIAIGTPVEDVPQPIKPKRALSAHKALQARGWPSGLAEAFEKSVRSFPLRIVVVDNSYSMEMCDGKVLVEEHDDKKKCRAITCSRWTELTRLCLEMGEVAQACGAPTHFNLLNASEHGQYFAVGDDGNGPLRKQVDVAYGTDSFELAMSTSPNGSTPLTESVRKIISLVRPMEQKLRTAGQQVVVVLATDGLPNDSRTFLSALQELQSLPVWIIVRLCTNEDSVVDYWSDLDRQLERPLETLDDLESEAKEIGAKNPWLAYAPALHVARTMGLRDKLFDLIDERPLAAAQVKYLMELLSGCSGLDEPEMDFEAFVAQVERLQSELPLVYNPAVRKMTGWIDTDKLAHSLGKAGACAIM